jgi:hypothetical protein
VRKLTKEGQQRFLEIVAGTGSLDTAIAVLETSRHNVTQLIRNNPDFGERLKALVPRTRRLCAECGIAFYDPDPRSLVCSRKCRAQRHSALQGIRTALERYTAKGRTKHEADIKRARRRRLLGKTAIAALSSIGIIVDTE